MVRILVMMGLVVGAYVAGYNGVTHVEVMEFVESSMSYVEGMMEYLISMSEMAMIQYVENMLMKLLKECYNGKE